MEILFNRGWPPPIPQYQQEAVAHIRKLYTELINDPQARVTPLVHHYRSLGPCLVILYLLLPPTPSKFVFYFRYPLFAFLTYLQWKALQEARTPKVALGYGVGLISAWGLLWGATLVIFGDARSEFKRIEKRVQAGWPSTKAIDDGLTALIPVSSVSGADKQDLRRRTEKGNKGHLPDAQFKSSSEMSAHYVWQTLPPTLLHRLDWVLDLVSNFRGVGWSHQIPTLPPPPPYILSDLNPPYPHFPQLPSNPPSRFELSCFVLPNVVIQYLAIDTLKYIVLQDPYFILDPSSPASTSPYPFPKFSRIAISLLATYTCLTSIFLLSPLFFACILGPVILAERADTWLYPPYFGPASAIVKNGIAGCWGTWWHQVFRFAFDSCGEFLARGLGEGWERKTAKGSALRLFTAFFLSGYLHFCGSYSTVPSTRPFNAFLFFALQPLGILTQRAASNYLRKIGWRKRMSPWIRGVGNVAVVVLWFYATGGLIADDFSRSGIWLFEPVPFSFWRWKWVWGGRWLEWYGGTGAEWWWQRGWAS